MEFLKDNQYKVKLEIFEGPLDLLLHLIHKNELDICEIEISLITKQYLEYIEILKELNINIAGEFLVMASTLTEIKSKMLLPSLKTDGSSIENPNLSTDELIERLILYKKYKEAASKFEQMSLLGRDTFKGVKSEELPTDENIELDIFQLLDAFIKIKKNLSHTIPIEIKLEEFSVKEAMSIIGSQIAINKTMKFIDIFDGIRDYGKLIAYFLAILEMMKMGLLVARKENDEIVLKSRELCEGIAE